MKTKLMVIGILGMFLLTGIASLTAIGTKESLLEQLLYNKNKLDDGYDLVCFQPNIYRIPPFQGKFRCTAIFHFDGGGFCPGGWWIYCIWDKGTSNEKIIGSYYYEKDLDELGQDDVNIDFKAPDKGIHTVTVVIDYNNERNETDETNNDFPQQKNFQWITARFYYTYPKFLRVSYLFPILQKLLLFQRFGLQ